MPKKKVLICGASGFIGRNIAERFISRDDMEVYGTFHESGPHAGNAVRMIRADLRVAEDVHRVVEGMDIIIQAAATTSGSNEIVHKPYIHVTDNAVMNSLILRAAYEHNVSHVVFFSCTVMYGSGEVPLKETDFDANAEMHAKYFGAGWTKVYLEKMCEFYAGIGSTKYTAIRHSNIYGPYDTFDPERSHVFAATVDKVVNTDSGSIVVWGSGEEERDLLYVSDLVHFVELAIERQKSRYELFNAGYGQSVSVDELARMMIRISGKDLKIEYDMTKPTIKTKLCLDTSRAYECLGWTPTVSLEEGIRKTMDWYAHHIGARGGRERSEDGSREDGMPVHERGGGWA